VNLITLPDLFLFAAVHFWAPTFKWGLVIAGLADINRPIEKVSTAQQSGSAADEFLFEKEKKQYNQVDSFLQPLLRQE
jgi:hypothetical protein